MLLVNGPLHVCFRGLPRLVTAARVSFFFFWSRFLSMSSNKLEPSYHGGAAVLFLGVLKSGCSSSICFGGLQTTSRSNFPRIFFPLFPFGWLSSWVAPFEAQLHFPVQDSHESSKNVSGWRKMLSLHQLNPSVVDSQEHGGTKTTFLTTKGHSTWTMGEGWVPACP